MSLMSVISHFFATEKTSVDLRTSEEKAKLVIPEDFNLKRHFLTQLRADIENALLPKMPDPHLKHYYQAAVSAEFQKRLSESARY